jgi:hypothetical protein
MTELVSYFLFQTMTGHQLQVLATGAGCGSGVANSRSSEFVEAHTFSKPHFITTSLGNHRRRCGMFSSACWNRRHLFTHNRQMSSLTLGISHHILHRSNCKIGQSNPIQSNPIQSNPIIDDDSSCCAFEFHFNSSNSIRLASSRFLGSSCVRKEIDYYFNKGRCAMLGSVVVLTDDSLRMILFASNREKLQRLISHTMPRSSLCNIRPWRVDAKHQDHIVDCLPALIRSLQPKDFVSLICCLLVFSSAVQVQVQVLGDGAQDLSVGEATRCYAYPFVSRINP